LCPVNSSPATATAGELSKSARKVCISSLGGAGSLTSDAFPHSGEYRLLTRKHLSNQLERLFSDFAGVEFHIAWAPLSGTPWDYRTAPTACSLCRSSAGVAQIPSPLCELCGVRQLTQTLNSKGAGHLFTCRLGVSNFWFPIQIRGVTVGIGYIQALNSQKIKRKGSRGQSRIHSKLAGKGSNSSLKVLGGSEFSRAARLLRLIITRAQALETAELDEMDLARSKQAIHALESEQTKLRKALSKFIPELHQAGSVLSFKSHAEKIVHSMQVWMQRDYSRPITLKQYAAEHAMNASYLSDLFSRSVGIPFRTYLTEYRMEIAHQFLREPLRSIKSIASATCYGSVNRFDAAFRKFSGLSPRAWRESMQINSPKAKEIRVPR
jgi:AraC-like DNA-binding protein